MAGLNAFLASEYIGEDARDRDGGAGRRLYCHRCAEAEDAEEDQDDTLDGVAHGVRDRVNGLQSVEGHLVAV